MIMSREPTIQDVFNLIQDSIQRNADHFAKQDARFDKQDEVFAKQDARFDKQDERFATHDARFDEIDQKFQDVLEAINTFATHVEERLDGHDRQFVTMQLQMNKIQNTMVTKDFLENKLADFKGELVVLSRKGNTKLSVLIDELVDQHVLDAKTAVKILALEPFPQIHLS